MQCWGLLGAMGSPAGALARGLRRDAPGPGVAGADIVVVGVLRYEVVDAEAGALAPVVFAIAAASPSCAVALRAGDRRCVIIFTTISAAADSQPPSA